MSNVKEFPEFDDAELQELNKSVLLEIQGCYGAEHGPSSGKRNLQKTLQERNREIKRLTYNFDRIVLTEDEMEKAERIRGLAPGTAPDDKCQICLGVYSRG